MKLLSFLKRWNGLNSIPQPSPLCRPAICSMIQLSVYWWAISQVSKGWTLTKMQHISFNSPPRHQAYKFLFLLFPEEIQFLLQWSPHLFTPKPPTSPMLPWSLKTLKSFKGWGWGEFFVSVLRFSKIKANKKLWHKQQQRQTQGHR